MANGSCIVTQNTFIESTMEDKSVIKKFTLTNLNVKIKFRIIETYISVSWDIKRICNWCD